jgi:hypothetical protein
MGELGQKGKRATIFGMVLGAALAVASFALSTPDREIDYSGVKKYVGGDAYNYQIEATIRSGEIAGAKAAKAIFLVGGAMLFGVSLIAFGFSGGRSAAQSAPPNISTNSAASPTEDQISPRV